MGKSESRPFWQKLFVAFVLTTGLPLVCTIFFYHILINRLYTAELGESYKEKLQIADTITRMWEEEMVKQAFIISMNEYQNSLKIEDFPLHQIPEYDYINNIMRLSSLLAGIVNTSSKYYSISILYEKSEFMVNSASGLVTNETGYSFDDFIDICTIGYSWITWIQPELGEGTGRRTEKRLGYVIPLMQYVSQNRGFIIFDIIESELSNVINGGMEDNEVQIFIMDKNSMILSDADKSNIGNHLAINSATDKIINSPLESDFFPIKIESQRFFVVYRHSLRNNWYYCSFVSTREQNHGTSFIFAITIIMIAGFLILTVSVSNVSAKKLYKPVKKMEYHLEDYHLTQMLSGIRQIEPSLNNNFPFSNFCCAILCLDHFSTRNKKSSDAQIEKIKTEIQRICHEKLSNGIYCRTLTPETHKIVIIMNFHEQELSSLAGIIKEIQTETFLIQKFSISAGIGKICTKQELHLSYNLASQALTRRLIQGPGSQNIYQENLKLSLGYYYPYDHEEIIINHLQLKSFQGASEALASFFYAIRDERNISIDNVIQACNQLLGRIIKHIVVLGISSRILLIDERNLYFRLSEFEFLDEIEKFFREILEKIIIFERNESAQKETPIDKIMAYIKTNSNKPFDLNKLSDEIGLSYSHVRRVFTAEIGENILNYVYKMKIELAKKMLKENEINITEIPGKLGFYNKQSFYRFFKKFEGTTPAKYRELK